MALRRRGLRPSPRPDAGQPHLLLGQPLLVRYSNMETGNENILLSRYSHNNNPEAAREALVQFRGSPSSSLSTSLPPSPSSWQKEDWEPDFLEAALISVEVKAGGVGGGGSGGIASTFF